MKNIKNSLLQGFTIVELIIAIAIIGTLAGITYVTYNGIQTGAQTSAVKEDLSGLAKALRVYYIRNQSYPTDLAQIGYASNKGTTYQVTVSGSTYCVTGTNGKTSYKISNATPDPQAGGCAGHGVGGQNAVVNLATNPGIEGTTSNLNASRVSLVRSSTWKATGSYSVQATPNDAANSDSFIALAGDTGGMRLGMQASKTYTISVRQNVPTTLTGTLDARAGKVQAYYKVGTGGYSAFTSSAGGSTAGERTITLTFSLPAGTTEAFIRLYHGGRTGSGIMYYDSIMLTEGSTTYNYGDGNSANWIWDGTANLSSSRGPAL